MEEEFDWGAAMSRLEKIATVVEDPSTGLSQTDALIREADELVEKCRRYLRSVRGKVESMQ